MFRLILFGGARLEGDAGPLTGRAAQKRRLALLALLASPPGARVGRDKLAGTLWPEVSDERARRNLSSALYDLRAELGEAAVSATGDAVSLDAAALPSDVASFTAALEADDPEAAVASYGGPFLDGFFIDEADDFERWVETERQRYARAYRQALEHVAEARAAAGDPVGAADAWHRLSVEDPFSARVAVGYMSALEAAGDRAGALRFAARHEALLRDELGAEPSPEVAALARRLRESPEAASLPQPAAPATAAAPPPRARARASASAPPRASASPPPRAGRRLPLALAAVVLVLAAVALVRWATGPGPGTRMATASGAGVGVAVLAFQNLAGDPAMDPFCEGLAEDIITGLGRVEALRIPSRTTMARYRGRGLSIAALGDELGVRYVLGGTVRREDARLRITASLEDARTGAVVWRDRYDLRMLSVFDAQEEIAQAVVRAVAPRVAGTVGHLVEPTTRDTAAYRLYLAGRSRWYDRGPGDLAAALSYFQAAIAQDPGYALAYAAMADVYNLLGAYDYGLAPPGDAFPLARAAADRALRLGPDLPEAHAALANVLFNHDWDLDGAEALYRRAIALNPGYGMARHWLAILLMAAGRPDEAYGEIHVAREMDPRSPVLSSGLARHHYFRRDFERSAAEFESAIRLDPTHAVAHLGLGLARVQLGDPDGALEAYARAASLMGAEHPVALAVTGHAEGVAGRRARAEASQRRLLELRAAGTYVPPHYLAIVALGLGDRAAALDRLDEAFAERSGAMLYLAVDPILDPLRDEPRFRALLRRVEERARGYQL